MSIPVAQDQFSEEYFERYERKSRILKRPNGDQFARHAFWSKYIARRIPLGSAVLEVGCGCGFFLRRLSEKYKATGVDISAEALPKARRRCPSANVIQADAQTLPFDKESYECVIAFDLVEHIADPGAFLAESSRILKPDGLLVFTTPNLRSFGAKCKGRRAELVGKPYHERYQESYIWRDDTHISLKMPEDWLQLARSNNFRIVDQGTDSLWDLPYTPHIPRPLQKLILVPFNIAFQYGVGFCSWPCGEVLVVVARRQSLPIRAVRTYALSERVFDV